jgi:hippurate hydrolase
MPRFSDDVRALQADMVALRRELHQHPELAYAETRTAGRVAEILRAAGLDVRTGVGGTGVIASVRGGRGPAVLLRADMDALPIQEESKAPYVSREPGKMHACGHDGHVAMAVTAARALVARGLAGSVRVLFQPAEEGRAARRRSSATGASKAWTW